MKNLWLWTLGTFLIALVSPIFWVPCLALFVAALTNSFNTGDIRAQREQAKRELRAKQAITIEPKSYICDQAKPESREKTYRERIEYITSFPNLYESMPEECYRAWEARAEKVVFPPDEWRLKRQGSQLLVDANWKFIFAAKTETPWQLYLYSIKDRHNLLKVGIAQDVLKRKEKYYQRCLKKWEMPRRDAIFIEELFKHTTYGFHSTCLPQWNVGNVDEEAMLPQIRELMNEFPDSGGITEVRQMDSEAAVATIEQLIQDVKWSRLYVDETLLKYGIQTFGGVPVGRERGAVEVPHLKWKLRPLENERADRAALEGAPRTSTTERELAKADLKEEKEIAKVCWRPQDWA